MVINAPKVNYKLNYAPGTIICPRTKQDLLWDDVKDIAKTFLGLSSEEKAELPYLQLDDSVGEQPLPEEMIVNLLGE